MGGVPHNAERHRATREWSEPFERCAWGGTSGRVLELSSRILDLFKTYPKLRSSNGLDNSAAPQGCRARPLVHDDKVRRDFRSGIELGRAGRCAHASLTHEAGHTTGGEGVTCGPLYCALDVAAAGPAMCDQPNSWEPSGCLRSKPGSIRKVAPAVVVVNCSSASETSMWVRVAVKVRRSFWKLMKSRPGAGSSVP
jgi:hypothetical protein